jgi:2'-5' RNA ligase superfamily
MALQPDPGAQSALAILVPEAERLVAPFREKYDPSAVTGMSAHITLLYPFLPPNEIDPLALGKIAKCSGCFAAFDFSLTAIRRFDGGVIYLAPEPGEPFRRLTLAIWNGWPQTPPYGGRYSEIVPHLTVAQVGDQQLCDGIAVKFALTARDQLPIKARATKVALLVKYGGKWGVHTEFALY